jgi:nucleoside-diphosphate-sugar epimerase
MRVFLTGSNGFIGSTILPELLAAGHQVVGLTRSDAGAAKCDAVIHTAFDHDFSHFVENCQKDKRAIEALGSAFEGSDRPIVITSSTAMGSAKPGEPATEDYFDPDHPNPRVASELAGRALSERGVNVSVVRLSQIHDTRKQGLVTNVIDLARKKNVSAFVGDGLNAWSATHVSDTAHLFRLALERRQAGARYHATAEGAIPFRQIAEAVGRSVGVPAKSMTTDEAASHFTWLSAFVGKDMSASSKLTQQRLNWHPHGPELLTDIAAMS